MTPKDFRDILDQGVEKWNIWRQDNPTILPNLRGANLSNKAFLGANFSEVDFYEAILTGSDLESADLSKSELHKANLIGCNLQRANLDEAILYRANCSGANFSDASFDSANLKMANLSHTKFRNANLINADLFKAELSNADLSGANLTGIRLIEANVQDCTIEGCRVYGVSAWNIKGIPKQQQNLIITSKSEIELSVDDLEVAQFVYLLLNNEKIRNVIDTVAKKGVLILGRFTQKRLDVLKVVSDNLRKFGYLPILFTFTKPDSRSFIETVSTVAHLSRFVIADFSEPKAVLEEVPVIMQELSIPLQPLVVKGSGKLPSTYFNLKDKHGDKILEPYAYTDTDTLTKYFKEKVIDPAEQEADKLICKKRSLLQQHNSNIF